jgi:adenylate kinase family enzyme
MNHMQRIFITGNAGTGKTTLGESLSRILNIDLIKLDNIVWQPGWRITSPLERVNKIAEIIQPKQWLIDGVSKDVLKAADTIIFLDFTRKISYWRVLKRNYKYLFKSRPGLPENCPEILIIPKLIKIVWGFPNKVRPTIIQHIEENKNIKNIFHISSNQELAQFLNLFVNQVMPDTKELFLR